jgi:hypothetical protein
MKIIEITAAIALFSATCTEARKLNDLPNYSMAEILERSAASLQ